MPESSSFSLRVRAGSRRGVDRRRDRRGERIPADAPGTFVLRQLVARERIGESRLNPFTAQ